MRPKPIPDDEDDALLMIQHATSKIKPSYAIKAVKGEGEGADKRDGKGSGWSLGEGEVKGEGQ